MITSFRPIPLYAMDFNPVVIPY